MEPSDFEEKGGGCYLNDNGRRRLLHVYERQMNRRQRPAPARARCYKGLLKPCCRSFSGNARTYTCPSRQTNFLTTVENSSMAEQMEHEGTTATTPAQTGQCETRLSDTRTGATTLLTVMVYDISDDWRRRKCTPCCWNTGCRSSAAPSRAA